MRVSIVRSAWFAGDLTAEPFTHTSGFGGLCAVIAALLALVGVAITVWTSRRNSRIAQWWERYTWTLANADDLGARSTYGLLEQLTRTAIGLGDADLIAYARQSTTDLYFALQDEVGGEQRNGRPDDGTLDDEDEGSRQ